MQAVAEYLTTIRRSQKISRAKLAELAGTTEMTILRIEKQGQEPGGPLLVRLMRELKGSWDVVTKLMSETGDDEDALERVLSDVQQSGPIAPNPDFSRFLDLVAGGMSPQEAAQRVRDQP